MLIAIIEENSGAEVSYCNVLKDLVSLWGIVVDVKLWNYGTRHVNKLSSQIEIKKTKEINDWKLTSDDRLVILIGELSIVIACQSN